MGKYWSDKTDNVDTVSAEDFNAAFGDIAEDMSKKSDAETVNTKLENKVDKVSGKGLIDSTFAENIDKKQMSFESGQGDEGVTIKPNYVGLDESDGASTKIKGRITTMTGDIGTTVIEPTQITVTYEYNGVSTEITPGEVQLLVATYNDDGEEVLTMHNLTDKANKGEIKGIVQNNDLAFADGKKITLKFTDSGGTGTNKLESSNITLEYNNMRTRVYPASVHVEYPFESKSVYVSPTDVEIKEGTNVVHALTEKANAADVGKLSDLATTDKSSIVAAINEVKSSGGGDVLDNLTYDSTNDIINSGANLFLTDTSSVAAYNGTFRGEIKVGQLGTNKWAYSISPTTGFSTSLDVTCTSGNVVHNLASKADTTNVITKTNTAKFTPTGDYQPATKKYVDDAIAALKSELGLE